MAYRTDPNQLARESLKEDEAARREALAEERDLAALGLPPAWAWESSKDAPERERARALLSAYILGAAHRAGLLDAFRALCIADARARGDAVTCRAFGVPLHAHANDPQPQYPERTARTAADRLAHLEHLRLTPRTPDAATP